MNRIYISCICLFLSAYGFAQNGKLLSKELIDISSSPYWYQFSENNTLKPDYEYLNQLNFYAISYQSDSSIVKGITLEPKREGLFPVVIFNRGGNADFAELDVSTLIYFTAKLAQRGYIIIASNYRENEEYGGADIKDVLYLTETLKTIEKADTNRIGMFGWSRGGMMTYLALQSSDKIKTAVVGNGPSDLFAIAKQRPFLEEKVFAHFIPDYWDNKEAELKKRSVIYWADELSKQSSLLILCGTNDRACPPEQAEKIAELLRELDYDFVLKKFETDHTFSAKKEELSEELINWFDNRL
ncbi:MAG: prolyl oligopeptidase family serine peptidase [Bacteroidetes bacterium]|nr:prolyl oligopeptidase family serine peptidase [Bacteroidota bacterium]